MPEQVMQSRHVEGGRMLQVLDAELARVGREIAQNYDNHGDLNTAKGSVNLTVSICKDPEYEDYYKVTYKVKVQMPEIPAGNPGLAMVRNGEIVVNHRGADSENPNQESFLDEPNPYGDQRAQE